MANSDETLRTPVSNNFTPLLKKNVTLTPTTCDMWPLSQDIVRSEWRFSDSFASSRLQFVIIPPKTSDDRVSGRWWWFRRIVCQWPLFKGISVHIWSHAFFGVTNSYRNKIELWWPHCVQLVKMDRLICTLTFSCFSTWPRGHVTCGNLTSKSDLDLSGSTNTYPMLLGERNTMAFELLF